MEGGPMAMLVSLLYGWGGEVWEPEGNGVVIHLPNFFDEIRKIEYKGLVGCTDRLRVSAQAHLVFDFHQKADELHEKNRGSKSIGTTKKGIGPAYSSKATRNGLRVGDLVGDFDVFSEKFRGLAKYFMERYPTLNIEVEKEIEQYRVFRDKLSPMVVDTVTLLNKALRNHENNILVEGANATMLDIDLGTYPMVTSSNCSVGGRLYGARNPTPKHRRCDWDSEGVHNPLRLWKFPQ
ncbi:Adenylosuccinate synthetase [Lamellibrachia satsuma]|nr:Adenylosuccinate synthetase [Lamellibrachia satsuma]